MLAWCEGLAYARKAGLDPAAVHASISGGAAGSWAMTNLAPRALAENYAPGFYVKHILKDLRLALECAAELKLDRVIAFADHGKLPPAAHLSASTSSRYLRQISRWSWSNGESQEV